MALPELPVAVARPNPQVDGVADEKPFYASHRGRQSKAVEYQEQPYVEAPSGNARLTGT